MIVGVNLVTVPVTDQDRALSFYTERVGFTLVTDRPFGSGQRWIELRIGTSATRFVLFTQPGKEGRVGEQFDGSLACDDVEATYRQLTSRGVLFEGAPTKEPWGTFAVMLDPDGNRFVLSARA